MMSKISRAGGHFVDMFGLRIVISILAVAGVFIIANSVAAAYEDTPILKQVQCTFFGTTRADCPAYTAALTAARDAEARARDDATREKLAAAEDRRKAAQILADAEAKGRLAQDKLDDIRAIQGEDSTFTLFGFAKDVPDDWRVTVATQYKSLVPPDKNPQYGCYFNLAAGSSGEARHWWFKNHGEPIKDDRRIRQNHKISESAWVHAKSSCEPVLIGQADG
ncbi:MAG: hypothetical protein ABJH52_17270 [Henriciella sp.]